MTTAVHVRTVEGTPRATESAPRVALDRLLREPASELARRYRDARAPRLEAVRGDLRGRMLAWPALDEHPIAAAALRAFAGWRVFPWRGKSFTPYGEDRGEGVNRVVADRLRLFRFETTIARSRAGDFDALQLDYDLPENPAVIRAIKDEMRELEPGLWLGQAYLHTRRRDVLWLYFGLALQDGPNG